jgi:hypothetical protein
VNILQVANTPGGVSQFPTAQPLLLLSPVEQPPLRFFRQVRYLRLTCGDADRIVLDDRTTVLRATFQPHNYNAVPSGSPLTATRRVVDGAIVVSLDAPRQVQRLRLSPSKAPSGYQVELYRMDGNTLAEKPTLTASVQSRTVILPANPDFTDLDFAIRLKQPGNTPVSLSSSDLLELWLRSYPTGARLGITSPADLSAATFFVQIPGEIGKATPASQGIVEVGAQLAEAINRYLRSLATPLPASLDIALVVESDAPCQLTFTEFNLGYHLVRATFPPIALNTAAPDKQTLRFSGGGNTQSVFLQLPRTAVVTSASLQVSESFRPDRPTAIATGSGTDVPPDHSLPQKTGIYLGRDLWVAQSINPDQPTSLSGVAVGLMAIAAETQVQLEIRDDWQNSPSGKVLASSKLQLGAIGTSAYATVLFADPVLLPPHPHWLLLQAIRGAAVWLMQAGNQPVQVLEASDQPGLWAELSRFDNQAGIYQLLSQPVAEPAPTGQPAPLQQSAVILTIANQRIAPVIPAETSLSPSPAGTTTYDLAPAINAYLASQPATVTQVPVPLAFSAIAPGLLTVYPPVIEYDA